MAIVYLTKPNQVERCVRLADWPKRAAVVGRYGLPLSADVTYLQKFKWEVNFIGDADPVDLLVFAWLRQHLSIRWLGVSDTFLQSQGSQVCPSIQMQLSSSEQAAIQQLPDLCPDYRSLLGEECSAVLEAGMKIELEGTLPKD